MALILFQHFFRNQLPVFQNQNETDTPTVHFLWGTHYCQVGCGVSKSILQNFKLQPLTPTRSCQHLNFVSPAKEDSTDWETCTEKIVQIALIFSRFFSAAPKLLDDFSQQVHNARENSNCLYTCWSLTLPIHGLFKSFDFTDKMNGLQEYCCILYFVKRQVLLLLELCIFRVNS